MVFSEKLNEYITAVNCSAKELSVVSGVSQATISRYRNQKKSSLIPLSQITSLSKGLSKLSNGRFTYDEVFADLSEFCVNEDFNIQTVVDNLNILIEELNINASELAKSLNFDASYLSKIRNGKRTPSDIGLFVKGVSNFIIRKSVNEKAFHSLCSIIGSDGEDLRSDLEAWLLNGKIKGSKSIFSFLSTLDSFNLEQYISAVHFDELKTPTLPFTLPTNKNFYGIEEMRKGELAFYRSVVLSKSKENLFMHSQMPISGLAEDREFFKKTMIAIAMLLKKGIHIDIIHNVDRPWNEMMLGLEGWIPLYMTGQISPYYFSGPENSTYLNALSVSGTAAIIGEGVDGFESDSKYYVTTNRDEVAYYRRKANNLLSKATELMTIYREDSKKELSAFFDEICRKPGDRHIINSTLPIVTLTEELFKKIAERNALPEQTVRQLWSEIENAKMRFLNVLSNNAVTEEIPLISEEDFEKEAISLSMANTFFSHPIYYTYNDYKMHMELTKSFAQKHDNYRIIQNKNRIFKNIKISILGDELAMVSKDIAPTIHFVIRHPRIVSAISNFDAIISE